MQPTVSPEAPRRGSGILPPWWSCLLMTAAVFACVGGLAAALVALGVRAPESTSAPELVIRTAPPELLRAPGAGSVIGTPISAIDVAPVTNFSMSGPTLPAIVFTPTPQPIVIGRTVIVVDVDDQQLNVRDIAGIVGTSIVFRAPEGTRFLIGDGPVQADGLTWWRIDDPSLNRSGWAASNYLQPVTE
jgi:hypothetical protein